MDIRRRKPAIDTRVERPICTGLIVSEQFLASIRSIYKPGILKSDFANTVAAWVFEYYDKYGKKAPKEKIEEIWSKEKDNLDPAQAELIKEFLSSISQEYENGQEFNLAYELDNAREYFRACALDDHWRKVRECATGGRIEDGELLIQEFRPVIVSNIENENGFTMKGLAEMQIQKMQWIIEGIIPTGLTLLAGKPKMGKSSLILNMAIDVALGRKVFDSIPSNPGEVLYLALEDTVGRVKTRVEDILNSDEAPENCTVFPQGGWPRLDQGGLEKLEKWLEDHPDTRLIIIDTIQKIRKPQKKSGHFYNEDYEALAPLQELAGKHKIAIIGVHHTRKTKADDVFDEISGTTGLTACADTLAVMTRTTGQADRILAIRGRDIADQKFAFKLSRDYRWVLAGDAADFQDTDQRQAICDYLKRANCPVERAELMKALEGKIGKGMPVLIAKLVENGSIEKISRGIYASRGYQKSEQRDKVIAIGRERVNVKRRRRV